MRLYVFEYIIKGIFLEDFNLFNSKASFCTLYCIIVIHLKGLIPHCPRKSGYFHSLIVLSSSESTSTELLYVPKMSLYQKPVLGCRGPCASKEGLRCAHQTKKLVKIGWEVKQCITDLQIIRPFCQKINFDDSLSYLNYR